jgi:hypothetical protein
VHARIRASRLDERRADAEVAERRGVDAACDVADLVEGRLELVAEDVELGDASEPEVDEAEVDPQRDQLLLRAVVEIALDPAPLVDRRRRRLLLRDAQLLEDRLALSPEARGLDAQANRRGGGVDELRILVERSVVHEHRLRRVGGPERAPGPS